VTKGDRVELLVQGAIYNFGGLDILVNAAGAREAGTILETDEKRWDRMMQANLKGPFLVSRLAVTPMKARGGGSIVNIASSAALHGARGASAYAAAKGGLVALTKSMAIDFAPDRIRVNAVCPGSLASPSSPQAPQPLDGGALPEAPLGRAGTPDDVARLALYLASEEAAWVTGADISVDGGQSSR